MIPFVRRSQFAARRWALARLSLLELLAVRHGS
jgi:hypothetical protein